LKFVARYRIQATRRKDLPVVTVIDGLRKWKMVLSVPHDRILNLRGQQLILLEMKKIVFFIISSFIILSSGIASNSLIGVGVSVDISFGRNYPNCNGRGLCHVKVDIDIDKSAGKSHMTLDEERGTLEISTPQKSLIDTQPEKLIDFQGKNSYNFMEDWVAPAELNKALKASKPIVIKAGTYPLKYKNGIYTIIVKL
jgi:hypothetical protein